MTNSKSVEQDGIVAGNIFAMLNNANRAKLAITLVVGNISMQSLVLR